MKNKPVRHKETNTFKTRKYAEILAEIDVRVHYQVPHRNEIDSEEDSPESEDEYLSESSDTPAPHKEKKRKSPESKFHKELMKWEKNNLTNGFKSFKQQVYKVRSLAQVILHKKEVADSLKKYLAMKDISFIEPLLDLTVSIAIDLNARNENYFYEFFINENDYKDFVTPTTPPENQSPSFLKLIIDLLTIDDVQIVECAFKTLAFLFKFMWKDITRNIDKIVYSLLPLLSSKNQFFTEFAAETFSYVARKIVNFKKFLEYVFDALEKFSKRFEGRFIALKMNQLSTTGIGKLLFQVIAGITGQFHSNAEKKLELYIDVLTDNSWEEDDDGTSHEKVDRKFNVIEQVFNCITKSIDARHSQVLWTVLFKKFDQYSRVDNKNHKMIVKLSKLTRLLIDYRNGVMLLDPVGLKSRITNIIFTFNSDVDILTEIIDLASGLLLASSVKLSQETSSEIVTKLLMIKEKKISYYAIERLVNHSSFESLILPRALDKIRRQVLSGDEFGPSELDLFARVVSTRSPHCLQGHLLKNWRKINIDLPAGTFKWLKEQLNNWEDGNFVSKSAVKIIFILPHLNLNKDANSEENILEVSKNIACLMYKKLMDDGSGLTPVEIENISFAFLAIIESLIHTLEAENFHEFVKNSKINLVDLGKKFINVPFVLDSLDLILTFMAREESTKCHYINLEMFEKINEFLDVKLTSPYRKVRLTVSHIFSLFSKIEDLFLKDEDDEQNVLERLYLAENIEVSVYTYRDRLLHLQALAFNTKTIKNFNKKYLNIPLRFLIGNLYVNFQLVWDSICQLIASYANENFSGFWSIFIDELKKDINNVSAIDKISSDFFLLFKECGVLENVVGKLSTEEKPDFYNFKISLWNCMNEFSEYVQMKGSDVTPLFIDFVENNFLKLNMENAKTFDILKKEKISDKEPEKNGIEDEKTGENNKIEDDEEEEDKIEDDDEENKTEQVQNLNLEITTQASDRKLKTKLLLAQLKVFSKLQNPRKLYREPEIHKIYMELITSKDSELQKATLDCLIAYKHKWLTPYKDHLYGLIDEKNLRNELARFKVTNEENSLATIDPTHRNSLMPILMKLIYAKMTTRGTGRTGGAAGGPVRRKIILRFLMGVKEEEMMLFVQMAFKIFEQYGITLSTETQLQDLNELTINLMKNIDFKNIIPPKRLTSAVNLLGIIIEEFGGKMSDNLLPRLLAILISIMSQVKIILENSNLISLGVLSTIKGLKTNCLGIIARFFDHFDNYKWSTSELNALFNVGVFPYLEKLPIEGVHSPTTLLKLLSAWAHNPRYFCLLVKYEETNVNKYPLEYVMQLLLKGKVHGSVTSTILTMLEKLLTLQDYGVAASADQMDVDGAPEIIPINPTNILPITNVNSPDIHLNYGSAILLSHIPEILKFIQNKFQRSKSGINRTESIILERISELQLDPETSNALISMSLPILLKRASKGESEETILQHLTTISNLMKDVQQPQLHLRQILPLLSSVHAVGPRKVLINLLVSIADKTPDSSAISREVLQHNMNLLKELNANDQRWIDQPDCEKRIDAFDAIIDLLNSENRDEQNKYLTLEFGVGIIHSCYNFLENEKDLGLKNKSEDCLNILGPKLAGLYKHDNVDRIYLIEKTILMLLKKGVISKNEGVSHVSLSLLRSMSIECPDVHPVFRDLNSLADEKDPEVDFFENIRHLQLNRRGRAMERFCTLSEKFETKINTKTLVEFIYPLSSMYLCNESFHNKNSLIDSAIKAVGCCCRLLSWNQYLAILKYYLNKLKSSTDFQRQLTRIIIGILNAFHYDLSKLDEVDDVVGKYVPEFDKKSSKKKETEEEEEEEEEEKIAEENDDEKLHEELENISEENDDLDNEKMETNDKENKTKIVDKKLLLSKSAAKKLVFDITHTLLPQLHRAILSRTQHELSHKVNRRVTGADKEEEELMRVPIALAMVKLLQKLPGTILKKNLPGIFMKLCTFLKSRLESVRRETRKNLEEIMKSLGPDYLHYLLREMNSLLTKGFHIHVLAYTIHAVLLCLKDQYKENDMNDNLQSVLQVCRADLFGLTAEEKEISAVINNTSEAKSTKSFDIFHILAQYITHSSLIDLIKPLVDKLNTSRSAKVVRKVDECLRNVVLGLADNTLIQPNHILPFLHGIITMSIPNLTNTKQFEETNDKKLKNKKIVKSDTFIIQPEPKNRMGLKSLAKTSVNTNDHIIIEFGLKLLHILLKREEIPVGILKQYLNSFVPVLADNLKSQHIKLTSLSLQCLNWVLKMDLNSCKSSIKDICNSLFKILHKYAVAGLGKGDNFDLVMAAFKTMSVIVRDVKYFNLSPDQLKALILYAEQDLDDYDRQATAFNLLRAILHRKIIINDIHGVMNKVALLSVTSESENTRQQSRGVFYTFLIEYPLGKTLQRHLSFYLTQLAYELKTGRLSALNMIESIVNNFPIEILAEHSDLIFIMLAPRLVNDDEPECREYCAKIIQKIISKIDNNDSRKLFNIVLTWMGDKKNISNCQLAAQLCGLFVLVEKDKFQSRLSDVLPLILRQFEDEKPDDGPGKFVRKLSMVKKKKVNFSNIKDKERLKDHLLFQVLQLTCKISEHCTDFLENNKWSMYVKELAEYIGEDLLRHSHLWVRYAAIQQMKFILKSLDIEKIDKKLKKQKNKISEESNDVDGVDDDNDNLGENDKFKWDVHKNRGKTFKKLSLDLIDQLHPNMELSQIAEEVVENLSIIAEMVKSMSWSSDGISLFWILRRLKRAVNSEVSQNPKSIIVRQSVFSWIKNIVVNIDMRLFSRQILFHIMTPLVREIETTDKEDAPLRQQAKAIARIIKNKLESKKNKKNSKQEDDLENENNEENESTKDKEDIDYVTLLHDAQQKINAKRGERAKARKQQFVLDPEVAAKRKIARQIKKKEAKKRKNTEMYGKNTRSKKPRRDKD